MPLIVSLHKYGNDCIQCHMPIIVSALPDGFSGEDRACAECIEISLRPVSPCTCEQCMTDVEYEEYHEQLKKITEGQKSII